MLRKEQDVVVIVNNGGDSLSIAAIAISMDL